MTLSTLIKRGVTQEPIRIVLHGVPGVGKTTFAADIPGAVFVGPEDGAGDLDISRIVVHTWAELLSVLAAFVSEPSDYRALVLDTIDWIEKLLHQHITKGACSMEAAEKGYGKAYKLAAEETLKLTQTLDAIRMKRRMAIVALAHTGLVKFDDPEDQAYDRYQIRIHKDAAPIWSDWADVVLFANFDIKVRRTGDDVTKGRGKALDREPPRVLYTSRRPAFDAKNRYKLDHEIPLSWADFSAAIDWSRREAAWRGTAKPETADPLVDAAKDAQRRGWTKADFAALLDSFGVAKLGDVKPEHRAGVIAKLGAAPSTSHQEAK